MEADRILAKELVDYAKYDKLLEWQRTIPWINNLAAKKAKGTFKAELAIPALAKYAFEDVYGRYVGRGSFKRGSGTDKATKLLFGRMYLAYMMPRINTTATRMKKVGLVKGKLVKPHPDKRYR